jgi:(p)ppGpp synthase/HD superfamily hydrolase
MSIILSAAGIAARYHRDQKRDSNGKPYMTHLVRVAGRTAAHPDATEEDVAGAFLHDILEDQATNPERRKEIVDRILDDCGPDVLRIVAALTNASKGSSLPRHERKKMDREYLARAPRNVKIIKLIDRIDNLNEFSVDVALGLDRRLDFLLKYCEESLALLTESLKPADTDLEIELAAAVDRLGTICQLYKLS